MTPNWSAVAALARTLVILAASTFVGALALPLGVDGTLPMTWGAWKPVLAVAVSASIVAEIVWIRSHLAAYAAALGLPVSSGITIPPETPKSVIKDNRIERGFASLGALFAAGVGIATAMLVAALLTGCVQPASPAQQAQDALTVVACVEAHWGEPAPQLAGDCLGSEESAAEDIIADIEAILEGQAILKGGDATAIQQACPYRDQPRIVALVAVKRGEFVKRGGK